MKSSRRMLVLFIIVPLVFCLSACASSEPVTTPEIDEQEPVEAVETQPEETELVPPTVTETDPSDAYPAETQEVVEAAETETEESLLNPLPADPIAQTIQTNDGVELTGFFYPAAEIDAPLLVLFHWALGDQRDWLVIAPWLQNRGYQPELHETASPWLDSSWFPAMPEDVSFNVFTFTFRGCEGGCQQFDREGWLLDVEAVMDHVAALENVDLSQLAAIGASIGSDGAAYGCHYFNEENGVCQGALSNSPGGYLTIPYPDEVSNLGNEDPPKLAWCVYSSGDSKSANACENTSGDHYQTTVYTDSAHGMAMFEPTRDPNPMEIIMEFLTQIGICETCH
ncbi:MAG: hypothetical protein U9R53_02185 [Chloroflexota bacterium]|nr:hypothetical protein [Chloroflexota bacterium]